MKNLFTPLVLFIIFGVSNLIAQDIYEPNNDYLSATKIDCGEPYEAFIQILEDKDWYEIDLLHSGYLNVRLTAVTNSLDLNLQIFQVINNQLIRIADDDDDNAGAGQEMWATTFINSGTYYISVEDENNNSFNSSESYTLIASCHENKLEVNQTIEMATLISQDTCFEENIWGENELFFNTNQGDDDQDWFKVVVNESGILNAELRLIPNIQDLNLEIYIFENGQSIKIADDDDDNASGGQDLTTSAYVSSGTYYIRISDENFNATIEETFNFCLSFTPNDLEVNQTIELATSIPQDTCFEEFIWGENELYFTTNEGDDDQDWFKVNVNESGVLNAEVTSVPSILDLNLEIYIIENGQPIEIADDDDDNAGGGQDLTSVAFVMPGTYYIRISDENFNATIEEKFNFCLSFLPNKLEVNQTIALASSIPQDTCFEENIWGENELFFNSNQGDDDQDWFEVDIEESGILKAEITSVPSVLDLNLEIYDIENGQPVKIADDDDDNANGGQDLVAAAFINSGTYYIRISDENFNTNLEETFNFCLSFTPNKLEVNQTLELATLIPTDTCFIETIWGENELFLNSNSGDNDQDWLRIEIEKECKLRIDLTNVPSILDLNLELFRIVNNFPQLELEDNDSNASGGQEIFMEGNLEPGTYYIHLEDENNNATTEQPFNVCISCEVMVSAVELLASEVHIYPNPNSGYLFLQNTEAFKEYEIINGTGNILRQGKLDSDVIDMSFLNSGIFFIKLINKDFSISRKIVKQ